MKTILLILILSSFYAFSKKAIIDKTEAFNLRHSFLNLKGYTAWNDTSWEHLTKDTIFQDLNYVNFPGLKFVEDRDTLVNGENISIVRVSEINFENLFKRNRVEGGIFFGYLPKLKKLKLVDIVIPYSYGNDIDMPNIKEIIIENCSLSDGIKLNEYKRLETLYINESSVGVDLNNIDNPKLESIEIYDTKVISKFSIVNLESLKKFIIDLNIKGSQIPTNISLISNLDGFASELTKLPNAEEIVFYRTGLFGEIDKIESPNLKRLELHGNFLKGELPKIESQVIERIDLSDNQMTGNYIPYEQESLKEVNLSENKLSGEINFDLDLKSLKVLKLDDNLFEGPIPNINGTFLQHLDLSDNNFNSFRNEIHVQEQTYIDISNNIIPLEEVINRVDLSENYNNYFEHQTIPPQILRNFKFGEVDYQLPYMSTDVVQDNYDLTIAQRVFYNIEIDKKTGRFIIHNMKDEFEYGFIRQDGYLESNLGNYPFAEYDYTVDDQITENRRYTLIVKAPDCDVYGYQDVKVYGLSVIEDKDIIVSKEANSIFISNQSGKQIKSIQIYNLLGNEIFSEVNPSNIINISNINLNQVYIIKFIINDEVYIRKI